MAAYYMPHHFSQAVFHDIFVLWEYRPPTRTYVHLLSAKLRMRVDLVTWVPRLSSAYFTVLCTSING